MLTLCLSCCFSEGEEDDGIRIQYLLYQQLVLVYLSQRSERTANHSQTSQCQPISDKKNMAEDTAKNLTTQTPKSSRRCVYRINGVQNRSSWRDSHSERWDLGNWTNYTLFYKVRIRKRVSVRHQAARIHTLTFSLLQRNIPEFSFITFRKRMYDEEWCWERERERENRATPADGG